MPLYEYECDACQHRFEVIQKYSDAPIATCPKCAGAVQKLLSSPAIQFKGSGWYITDYARAGKSDEGKSSSKNDAKSSDSKSTSGSDSKSDTTSETKTESKSEPKSEPKGEPKSESKPASSSSTS